MPTFQKNLRTFGKPKSVMAMATAATTVPTLLTSRLNASSNCHTCLWDYK